MTSKPTDEPTSGAAVEQPPNSGPWHPTVTVYDRGREPLLWVYWPSAWTLATVTDKHAYPNGLIVLHVELAMPNPDGTTSRVSRAFAWGRDNIRPA